MHNTVSN